MENIVFLMSDLCFRISTCSYTFIFQHREKDTKKRIGPYFTCHCLYLGSILAQFGERKMSIFNLKITAPGKNFWKLIMWYFLECGGIDLMWNPLFQGLTTKVLPCIYIPFLHFQLFFIWFGISLKITYICFILKNYFFERDTACFRALFLCKLNCISPKVKKFSMFQQLKYTDREEKTSAWFMIIYVCFWR